MTKSTHNTGKSADDGIGKTDSKPRIALALSGGGSRAMAFHLGCLRGLHKAGLLNDVAVMSSVSGGSVLAALYCSTPGDFDAFEEKVRRILRQGFMWPVAYRSVTSFDAVKAALVSTFLRFDRTLALIARAILFLVPRRYKKWSWLNSSPFRRAASRTTILQSVFHKTFAERELSELRDDRPPLIIVACELRARAAIYFTKSTIHCWRYGRAEGSKTPIAQAVAASAAFPLLLPALDTRMPFTKNGITSRQRVILTDGGVYDNMGLAPFWPDRDPKISMVVPSFTHIIACRAGYPLSVNAPPTFAGKRMGAVFDSVFMRAQNAATQKLFQVSKSEAIDGLLLPYLGQNDDMLQTPVEDLVPLAAVEDYPTDFASMTNIDMEALIGRGETLVASLLMQHWSH